VRLRRMFVRGRAAHPMLVAQKLIHSARAERFSRCQLQELQVPERGLRIGLAPELIKQRHVTLPRIKRSALARRRAIKKRQPRRRGRAIIRQRRNGHLSRRSGRGGGGSQPSDAVADGVVRGEALIVDEALARGAKRLPRHLRETSLRRLACGLRDLDRHDDELLVSSSYHG
jgi:hypothetical protein